MKLLPLSRTYLWAGGWTRRAVGKVSSPSTSTVISYPSGKRLYAEKGERYREGAAPRVNWSCEVSFMINQAGKSIKRGHQLNEVIRVKRGAITSALTFTGRSQTKKTVLGRLKYWKWRSEDQAPTRESVRSYTFNLSTPGHSYLQSLTCERFKKMLTSPYVTEG